MKLLISPHPDDEILFASYTIMREKPLVIIVTHPTLQGDNGYTRLLESYQAVTMLDAPIAFLGILEDLLDESILEQKLKPFVTEDTVYVPALDGGHKHHDIVHRVGNKLFSNVKYYRTYGENETRAKGEEVRPTNEELKRKQQAMSYFKTQMELPATRHYFLTTKEYI